MAATPGYRDLTNYQNVNMSPTWFEVPADPAVVGPVGDGGRQQLLEGVVQPRTGDHHRGEDVVCLGALMAVLLSVGAEIGQCAHLGHPHAAHLAPLLQDGGHTGAHQHPATRTLHNSILNWFDSSDGFCSPR